MTDRKRECFPDGTAIDPWFYDDGVPALEDLGRQYVLTDHGIFADGTLQTEAIQALIDRCHEEGGGVIVVPEGTFLTGALFFKPGVDLYLHEGGMLKGSDDIADYPIRMTRVEGLWKKYFTAMINADGCDGFTIAGKGTIDGNGHRAWKAFWLRREWKPDCTNLEEQRAKLVFISNSKDVTVAGVSLLNAMFWSNHIYKCSRVRYLNCRIVTPLIPVPAPSTDALDIDACTDVHVKNCYVSVNDDGIVIKGGKGPWADTLPENGISERVLIEDVTFGFCHACFTCGSECVDVKNVLLRRCKAETAFSFFRLKLRPDTPQHYAYITVEDCDTAVVNFININPWTQFFDLQDRKDIPMSYADHMTFRNCTVDGITLFNVAACPDQYELSDFVFDHVTGSAENNVIPDFADAFLTQKDVSVDRIGCCDRIRNTKAFRNLPPMM